MHEFGSMKVEETHPGKRAFATLRTFVQRQEQKAEHCELCHVVVGPEHSHLLKLEGRRLVCSCDACALLFSGGAASKYRRLPSETRRLRGFSISEAEWSALGIPINLAFFVIDAEDGSVSARYPSPGGATESRISPAAWRHLAQSHPRVESMEPEVQALLVNRVAQGRPAEEGQSYLVPVDLCYRLVGVIRKYWRGFSGGTEVWQEVEKFFSQMSARSIEE